MSPLSRAPGETHGADPCGALTAGGVAACPARWRALGTRSSSFLLVGPSSRYNLGVVHFARTAFSAEMPRRGQLIKVTRREMTFLLLLEHYWHSGVIFHAGSISTVLLNAASLSLCHLFTAWCGFSSSSFFTSTASTSRCSEMLVPFLRHNRDWLRKALRRVTQGSRAGQGAQVKAARLGCGKKSPPCF